MKIQYDQSLKAFHLCSGEMSYAFGVAPDGRLLHLYWGGCLSGFDALRPLAEEAISPPCDPEGVEARKERNFELPTREPWDYGDAALMAEHADGERGLRLVYKSHAMEGDRLIVVTRDAF